LNCRRDIPHAFDIVIVIAVFSSRPLQYSVLSNLFFLRWSSPSVIVALIAPTAAAAMAPATASATPSRETAHDSTGDHTGGEPAPPVSRERHIRHPSEPGCEGHGGKRDCARAVQ
jgi:hypothetical protein